MIEVKQEGNRKVIDVRELINSGRHPRNEIIREVQMAPVGTVFEVHLPHPAPPLVASFESMGMTCIMNQLNHDHYRLISVKLS
ncbi:amino acid decarboxylase [Ammoniphilus resinae]|uniref:DUF2249 domain-containing protein n=1 Tax=Ammoniphilus resinae TaxID=861532 RepID=A0ABS4GQ13_9BACL|nr:amino acid decarboxylase [Ammoniphilus resinae]MBP1932354.1 hypothetical protein [Ammoniphilus resinae]